MKKIEIKKIDKKIELDTRVEGCWSDCWDGKTYKYSGYNADVYNADLGCKKEKKKKAKTCVVW